MKLPQDLSGKELVELLKRHLGYEVRRIRPSHMRVTLATRTGEHRLTVPRHACLRVGTLAQIVSDVADSISRPVEEVRRRLFKR